MPFLFDTASMPDRQAACSHGPLDEDPMLCCGVCPFGGHSCDDDYPGRGRSAALARQFSGSGLRLRVSEGALCMHTGIPHAGPALQHQDRTRTAPGPRGRRQSCAAFLSSALSCLPLCRRVVH